MHPFRRARFLLALMSVLALVLAAGAQGAASPPAPGTKTITVTRFGQTFERTVLDPVDIGGRLGRPGRPIVRYEPGGAAGAEDAAPPAPSAPRVPRLRLPPAPR